MRLRYQHRNCELWIRYKQEVKRAGGCGVRGGWHGLHVGFLSHGSDGAAIAMDMRYELMMDWLMQLIRADD